MVLVLEPALDENVHSLVFLADSHLLKVVLMIWGQGSQT